MTKKEEFEILKQPYLDAYKNANGKDVELVYVRGWVIIDPDRAGATFVRVADLRHLTEVLQNRTKISFPFKERFLDYYIVNSGNSDGFVITKEERGVTWECNLGNYTTLDDARDSAIIYFMIARPEKFHSSIFHRTIGSKTYHEWFTFKKVVEEEGLNMPDKIYCGGGMNCTIESKYNSFIKIKELIWEKRDNGN